VAGECMALRVVSSPPLCHCAQTSTETFHFWKQYKKKKKNASRVLEEFANVRTILQDFSSF